MLISVEVVTWRLQIQLHIYRDKGMCFPVLFLIPIRFPTFSLKKKQVEESGKKTFICINAQTFCKTVF